MKKDKIIKIILLVVVVAVISSTLTSLVVTNSLSGNRLLGSVSHSDYLDSSNVTYSDSNVQDSIDNLYTQANDYSSINNRLSSVESTLDSKATLASTSLTANRALISDSNGKVATSNITTTELGYLSGTKSNLQTQLTNISTELGKKKTIFYESVSGTKVKVPAGGIVYQTVSYSSLGASSIYAVTPTIYNSGTLHIGIQSITKDSVRIAIYNSYSAEIEDTPALLVTYSK